MTVVITLNTDGPREPEYLLEVLEAAAQAVRVANHLTLSHEALEYPSQADTAIRYMASIEAMLPQLARQITGWLEAERGRGRIEVHGGPYDGNPGMGVLEVARNLKEFGVRAEAAGTALEAAASVTSTLAAREDGARD